MHIAANLRGAMRPYMYSLLILGAIWTGVPSAHAQAQTPTTPADRPDLGQVLRQEAQGGGGGGASSTPAARAPRSRSGGSGASVVRGGGGGGGGGVRVQGAGRFNPIERMPIVYGEVPDVGEPFSARGPMTVAEFLGQWINEATGWNILPTVEAQGVTLQFWIQNKRPKEALEILKYHNVYYTFDPDSNFLYVMTHDQYLEETYTGLVRADFVAQYADIRDIEAVITNMLSEEGRLIADPRTSRLYVYDYGPNIDEMARIVQDMDVPVETQSFQLRYVDVQNVVESIEPALTEQGIIRVDPRTNTLVITDTPEKIASAARILRDLDRELVTKTWRINYAQVDEIANRVSVLVPAEMGEIVVDEMTHQMTVTAIPERIEDIDQLIKAWDVARRQVHIEAYLVTASSQVARNLGVNWAYFDKITGTPFSLWQGAPSGDLTVGPSTGDRFSIGTLPAPDYATDAAGNQILDIAGNPILQGWRGNDIAATLSYLDSRGQVTILSQGRVTVQDGEEASFENTSQVPYAQSTTDTVAGDDFRQTTSIAFVDVGTILKVLPRISDHDNILMEVSAEDSSSEFVSFTSGGRVSTAPEKRQNRAQTIVMVNDAQTLVIGGLRQSNFTDNEERFPLLGDLPLVGRAFKTTNRNHNHTDLLIFITVTIVGPNTSPEATRLAQADQKLASSMRLDLKPTWLRWFDRLNKGATEIGVSIGQRGDLYTEGQPATPEELRELLAKVKVPQAVTVVVRHHPRAPGEIVRDVTDAAAEAGLRVVFDNTTAAFVPASD